MLCWKMWIPLLFKTLLNRCEERIRPYLWIYQQNNFHYYGIIPIIQKYEEVFPTCSLSCQSPQLCSYIIKPAFTGITSLTENIHCACAKLSWKRQELRVWSTPILTVFCQKSTLANPRRVLPSFKLFLWFHHQHKNLQASFALTVQWQVRDPQGLAHSQQPDFEPAHSSPSMWAKNLDWESSQHICMPITTQLQVSLTRMLNSSPAARNILNSYQNIYTYIKPTYIFKFNYFNVCHSGLEILGLAFIFCERKEGCYKTISKKHSVVLFLNTKTIWNRSLNALLFWFQPMTCIITNFSIAANSGKQCLGACVLFYCVS